MNHEDFPDLENNGQLKANREQVNQDWWRGWPEFLGWQWRSFKNLFTKSKINNREWIWIFGTRRSMIYTMKNKDQTSWDALVGFFKLDPIEFVVICALRCTFYPVMWLYRRFVLLYGDAGTCFCESKLRRFRRPGKYYAMCLKCGMRFAPTKKEALPPKSRIVGKRHGEEVIRSIDTV